jgi:hypothetical protein
MLYTLLLATLAAAADPDDHVITEVAFGTGFGVMPINLGPTNDALDALDLPRLGPVQITPLSVNAELWIGRLVPGFDYIQWQNVGAEDADAHDTRLSYTLTELSFGYGAIYRKSFSFEPRIGFGLSDLDLVVNKTGTVSWRDAADPSRSLALHRQDMLADIGVGIGWRIWLTKPTKEGVGTVLRLGIRMGGLVQLFHTSPWKADDEKVTGMPDLYVGGPYLRLFVSPSLVMRGPKR